MFHKGVVDLFTSQKIDLHQTTRCKNTSSRQDHFDGLVVAWRNFDVVSLTAAL